MECTTTTVDLFAPWMKAQQSFWEPWRAAMQNGVQPAAPPMGMWDLPIAFWKAAIYSGLEVQLATAQVWKAWVCTNDANIPEATLGACQTLHFVEDWTRTQMQLWDGWFASLERPAPKTATQPVESVPGAVKPRSHERAQRHVTPTHVQSHNGVPV